MPVLSLYQHGATAGCPPGVNKHKRAKRGKVIGWTESSVRNNTRFLYSVDDTRLTGQGFALTLTVRHCPQSSDDWQRLINTYLQRIYRFESIRCHMLTEWQRRGVPHLHGAVWFPDASEIGPYELIRSWLDVAERYEPQQWSQTAKPIQDSVGWFQYVSKHAARGLHHYQRSSDNIPYLWLKTGRMWLKRGDWPTREAMRVEVDMPGFHRFRRLARSYRIANARSARQPRRISKARTMLKCSTKEKSSVRGVSDWIELDEVLKLVAATRALGHTVKM